MYLGLCTGHVAGVLSLDTYHFITVEVCLNQKVFHTVQTSLVNLEFVSFLIQYTLLCAKTMFFTLIFSCLIYDQNYPCTGF